MCNLDGVGTRGRTTARDEERRTREGGRALELFQLAFLEVATTRLPLDDFVLKGGANLRFFYRSARRSVDMDFDYSGAAARFDRFATRVDEVFASPALDAILRLRGIRPVDVRQHKQTPTTRRWKLQLVAEGVEGEPSKIEFSGRAVGGAHAEDVQLATVDSELAKRLRSRAPRLRRYGPRAAIAQKIGALRLRSHTEPRDVFDLDHLMREFPGELAGVEVDAAELRAARDRAMDLRYEDYSTAVVPYLQEELVDLYGSEDAWTGMQLRVVDGLEQRLDIVG